MNTNDLIRANLELVAGRAPDLTARFYERLFARHPEIRPMFHRRSAEAQQRMLLEAIVAVVDHLEDAAWLTTTLGSLGEKHVAYGVEDDMYPHVGEALVATLAEVSADAWSSELDMAWRGALGFVSDAMIAGAARARLAAAE